ncbi:MAG: polysaccharide deacetylase family protein [Actinobacteria bacterium]|nr:MAG: polysaccharide deacetylase family protein [Actinomycetota bacterium]
MLALPPAIVAGELVRLQTKRHVVALTFDGGGNADGAKRILAVLRRDQVPATFFLTGHFVHTYPAIARAIGRRYVVGNHTVDHADLLGKSDASVRWEITAAASLILRATGRNTHPLFRFPYGARDARTLRICHQLGYVSVRWTVDTWGWMGASMQSVGGAERRVLTALVPGEIVLMHLGSARDHTTIDTSALPAVIRAVRSRGYRFVTLRGVQAPR